MNNYLKVPEEIKMRMEWVYGIRCQDTKRSLQYTVGKLYADSTGTRVKYEKKMQEYNEELVYFVSNIVILLNVHLNRQRFYTQHAQEIISLAVSNLNGDIIATGEYSAGVKPTVHIWNSRTLENINVLKGVHQKGIHLLAFSSDDKFLITCGLLNPSAILIYDWAVGTIIVSSSIASPTQDILILNGTPSNLRDDGEDAELKAMKGIVEQKVIDGFVLVSLDNLIIFVYD
jgi:hypothetical protein